MIEAYTRRREKLHHLYKVCARRRVRGRRERRGVSVWEEAEEGCVSVWEEAEEGCVSVCGRRERVYGEGRGTV